MVFMKSPVVKPMSTMTKESPHNDTITVALAGNPNVGKTSLFNAITGSRQHVGNWPGVTVEKKIGEVVHEGVKIRIVDLPGTYSLNAYSLDEIVARDFIIEERPDVVVHIVDASNIERNLYLTTQLMELGARIVIALNMIDVAEKRGDHIDILRMAEFLEIPVIKTIGNVGYGVHTLLDEIVREARKPEHHEHKIGYGREVESTIMGLVETLRKDPDLVRKYPVRWIAIKLLERDENVLGRVSPSPVMAELQNQLDPVDVDEFEAEIADKRYEAINAVLRQVLRRSEICMTPSDMIDRVMTHKYLGIPIFLILMWGAFELTFTFASPFMEIIEMVFAGISHRSHDTIRPVWLGSLIGDGILGGVGFVLVFLPNILILFLLLSFLEDSGYMSRAAFIMDKLMYNLGLHGKSFIPLLMGFGCNIPAIMATRTIEDPKDRLLTILINPFISCGARLPVYILLAGAFFGRHAATVIFGLYMLGIVIAIGSAKLFRCTIIPGKPAPFIMELPPYRFPAVKTTVLHMWERGSMYLKKAGTIIFVFSIIIWALASFGMNGYLDEGEMGIDPGRSLTGDGVFTGTGTFTVSPGDHATFNGTVLENATLASGTYMAGTSYHRVNMSGDERLRGNGSFTGTGTLTTEDTPSRYTGGDFVVEQSFAADLGRAFGPFTAPLGFNWRMNTALIFGIGAKEVVVGTLGVLYGVGGEDDRVSDSLREDKDFSPLVALTLMVFVLLYIPCLATIPVMYRELGSLRWTGFQIAYGFILAWVVSFIIYRAGTLMGY